MQDSNERTNSQADMTEATSHALGNLLCIIGANADVISDYLPSSSLAFHCVEQIKKATKSAAELLREMKTP